MGSILPILLAAAACAVTPTQAVAQEQLSIAEYGKLPDVERAVISGSGDRIALLTTIKGTRVLMAVENQEKILTQVAIGDMKVRDIEWIGEDRLLVISSQTENLGRFWTEDKGEFYVGRVIPLAEGEDTDVVFGNVPKLVDALMGEYGIRKIDGEYYGYYGTMEMDRDVGTRVGFVLRDGRRSLYQVNLRTMSTKKVGAVTGYGVSRRWLIGADGEVAAILDRDGDTGEWKLKGNSNQTIAEGTNAFGSVWPIGFNADGTGVILGERTADDISWSEVPLAGGERKPYLDDLGIDRLYFDKLTGRIIGYLEDGEEGEVTFYDPAHTQYARAVRNAFPGLEMRMIDWTSSLADVIVKTSGNNDSGTYYAVDLVNSKASALAYERLLIGPDKVGPISTFEYTASDGLKMDGILTLPPGLEPKNLPVVMLPHGGPHSSDAPEFDWWAQAFASQGYAVFQPNFRGSTNRSVEFMMAGYGEWGGKMQTDKSDGLAALAEAGIVDPSRACIVGASYGGYAALAGVTVQQDIYRCAVAVAPVSDIQDMHAQDYRGSGRSRTADASLLEQLGPRDRWDEVSPLRLANQASAPIMLIHGKDDTVVPFSHSSKMADRLKDAGKPHEMITLKGEDHLLSLSETRQEMLTAAVGFVQKHNPAN